MSYTDIQERVKVQACAAPFLLLTYSQKLTEMSKYNKLEK
jgi:hypothetical protein